MKTTRESAAIFPMKTSLRSIRGAVDPITLGAVAALALLGGIVFGGWKPSGWFRKKPPVEQVTQAQQAVAAANAEVERLRAQLEQAKQAEHAAQERQTRYGQQMVAGARESLKRQPPEHQTAQTALASSLLDRADFALGRAIGQLPEEQQAEILTIVDRALSGKAEQLAQAQRDLAAKDAALAALTQERDTFRARAETLEPKLQTAETTAKLKEAELATTTNTLATYATQLDAKTREAGSLGTQLEKGVRVLLFLAGAYVFLAFILPGLVKHMESGRLKTALRDVSGFALNPMLHFDARKKLRELARKVAS